MPSRRRLVAALVATVLSACAGSSGSSGSAPPGIVVVTAGGTALSDGSDDVPPTLDLRISAGRPLAGDEVAAALDGASLSMRDAGGGALAASTAPMPLASAHRLDLDLPGRARSTIRFRVISPVAALAALHSDPRDGTVLDLAFAVAPDPAAVEKAVTGGVRAWIDQQHLRVTWPVAPGGRVVLPASTPTSRGTHLAGDLIADLAPIATGGLRLAAVPLPHAATKQVVLAFSVGTAASRASLADHAAQISVVSPTGLRAASDGSLLGATDPPSVAAASARGLPVWPLVQNDGFDGAATSRLLHDDASVGRLIDALHGVAARPGFGGIDLDFEELEPGDRDGFTAFVGRLAGALHGHGLRLAVAVVPHKPGGLNLHSAVYDLRAIAAAADLVTVMAYEQHGSATQPGPVAGLDWTESILAGTAPQLVSDHTVLGLATYARSWSPDGAVADGYAPAVAAALATPGARVDEDFAAGSLVIHRGDGGITYADPAVSLASRVGLAATHHLAGVAMWRLGFEDPAVWSELPAAARRP